MKNTVLRFGAYGFTVAVVLFLVGLYSDITTNVFIGYATIIVSLIFVYFGIKHFRDAVNNGTITIQKAIVIGLLISLFSAVGIALADYLYTAYVNPDFFSDYAETMKAENPDMEVQEFTSGSAALFMFGVVMAVGLIISLISALILQRKNQQL